MAIFNMCNRYDFVSNGRVVYKGAQFTEYEEVEQPKPEEPEEKKFDGSSLTGKVLGAAAAAGCVAAAVGLVAVWGVSAFFSGGATAAAAPLVLQAAVFLLAAAPIAMGASEAIGEQYNKDMQNQEDSGWGTYAKIGLVDPVVVGAQDIALGALVGTAVAGAGRMGSKLMRKVLKPRVVSPVKIDLSLLKTEPNTAFFWSGKTNGVGGASRAAEVAKANGGTTLEALIDAKNIKMPKWNIDDPISIQVWQDVSAGYAKQVSGEVRAVVGDKLRPGNIWENIELPRLNNNPAVTKITTIDPETGIETIVLKR